LAGDLREPARGPAGVYAGRLQQAIFAANHAILALEDAEQAAVAANLSNPDFTAVLSQVSDAVGQVIAIVQGLQGSSKAIAPEGGPLADMVETSSKIRMQMKK
jgi:hypothetical protein